MFDVLWTLGPDFIRICSLGLGCLEIGFTNGMAGRAEVNRGCCLRAKCKSLSKVAWNDRERRQNNSVENVFQRFALSFLSFFGREHDFKQRISTFVWQILFEEPRIWASGFNLGTRALMSVTAQERLDMRRGCHAVKILPVGVRGNKNVWCLSSLIGEVELQSLFPSGKLFI